MTVWLSICHGGWFLRVAEILVNLFVGPEVHAGNDFAFMMNNIAIV